MKLLEMGSLYFRRLLQNQRWKHSLASKNETQKSLSLSVLHGGICSYVPSNGN